MKHLLYAALALLLGVGAANAQNFTKSLQGSQDPRGPVAGDSLSNYYFPNHINAFGNLGLSPSGTCVGACGALTGTDNAGSIITSGTTLTVTFGQAFGAIPSCVMQEVAGAVAPTFTVATTAIVATVVVTGKTYDWICIGPQ